MAEVKTETAKGKKAVKASVKLAKDDRVQAHLHTQVQTHTHFPGNSTQFMRDVSTHLDSWELRVPWMPRTPHVYRSWKKTMAHICEVYVSVFVRQSTNSTSSLPSCTTLSLPVSLTLHSGLSCSFTNWCSSLKCYHPLGEQTSCATMPPGWVLFITCTPWVKKKKKKEKKQKEEMTTPKWWRKLLLYI